MIERAEYPVQIAWTQESAGVAVSAESGLPELTVSSPPEFGGPEGIWSPEHLLVAAVASCFMTTFLAIARISRLEVLGLEVPAVGTLERGEDRRYRFTRIILEPRIAVAEGTDLERVERLAQKAESGCLVSRSLTTEVIAEPRIEVGAPAAAEPAAT